MKNIIICLYLFSILVSSLMLFIPDNDLNLAEASNGINIAADSTESPIREYFTRQKIIWTFDDYRIEFDHHPPHKGFDGLTQLINSYGGHVNIMTIFTSETLTEPYGNEIRNYSVVKEFGVAQDKINKSLEFFNREKVYPQCHGWNYSSDINNEATLAQAYKIVNYTLWNWWNNYHIKPHFFLGASTSGNYNITLALKKFSEKYWDIYGENFRWKKPELFPGTTPDAPAIEYIGKKDFISMFDPLFGNTWGDSCKTLEEAIDLYNTNSQGKEILFIRGHPSSLNDNTSHTVENLTLWKNWIDWIYQEHELININHTQAIYYNVDRENFKVRKNKINDFTVDLTNCQFNHTVLLSDPYGKDDTTWNISDENGVQLDSIQGEGFVDLQSGQKYSFNTDEYVNPTSNTPGFEFILLFIAILFIYIIQQIKKKK